MKNPRYKTKTHLKKEAKVATQAYFMLMQDVRSAAEELHARKDDICTENGILDLGKLYVYNKVLEILKVHLGLLSLSQEEFEKHIQSAENGNSED